MNRTTNPLLVEVGKHFDRDGDLYDQAEYLRDILRAVGDDADIRHQVGDTSSIDRDNDAYRALAEVLHCYATPGDLPDAIEALEFLISLKEE